MYKIVGSDGKQYGPLSTELLKQWIAERRVERQTPVLVEGSADWTFLGLLPEFTSHFGPPTSPPLTPAPAARTHGFATTGLVCGILSIVFCCCCGTPFSWLGIVFSLIALSQISRHPEIYEGRGQAIAGLVLSGISIAGGLLSLLWGVLTGHTNVMFHTAQF